MRNVDMNGIPKEVQFAETNTFAAKPITMLHPMDVTVHRPCMEQRTGYPVLGQNTQSGSEYTTNQSYIEQYFPHLINALFNLETCESNVSRAAHRWCAGGSDRNRPKTTLLAATPHHRHRPIAPRQSQPHGHRDPWK